MDKYQHNLAIVLKVLAALILMLDLLLTCGAGVVAYLARWYRHSMTAHVTSVTLGEVFKIAIGVAIFLAIFFCALGVLFEVRLLCSRKWLRSTIVGLTAVAQMLPGLAIGLDGLLNGGAIVAMGYVVVSVAVVAVLLAALRPRHAS